MYVCYKKYENKQKEWHPATKPSDPDSDGPKDGSGDGMEKEDQKKGHQKRKRKAYFPAFIFYMFEELSIF